MKTSQSTPQPAKLSRHLGRIAGQLMALGVRFPAAAADLGFVLDIVEAIIDEQPATTEAQAAVVIQFPVRGG